MTEAVLTAESLGKRFGRKQVLKGAFLAARRGRVTAVMGRNGCGKSTLLDLVAGLHAPDFGQIRFAGRILERTRLHEMARDGLYYLQQRAPLTSRSRFDVGVYFETLIRRFGPRTRAQAEETLRLSELMALRPSMLSGGETSRVAMGLAVVRQPTCLLADEPFAGLAPMDQELIAKALIGLAERGTAVVVTGHDVPILLNIAHEVVWVNSGTTLALGGPDEALRHERFRREYLGLGGGLAPSG